MRRITKRYIEYVGLLKYIWYDGSIIRPCGFDQIIHNIYPNGTVVYYDHGVEVRTISPTGEEINEPNYL